MEPITTPLGTTPYMANVIVNIKKRAPFDEIRQGIIDRLETSIGFFNGAKIYAINCDCLTDTTCFFRC